MSEFALGVLVTLVAAPLIAWVAGFYWFLFRGAGGEPLPRWARRIWWLLND